MKKLGLLLFLFVCAAVVRAQSNIVKSLERNVPGQGKVTIHQDSRIEALLGTARTGTGEQTVIKSSGYRVQAYAGNNTRQAKNEAHPRIPRTHRCDGYKESSEIPGYAWRWFLLLFVLP